MANLDRGWELIDRAQRARFAGDTAQASALFDEATREFDAAGDSRGLTVVAHQRATILLVAGRLGDVDRELDEAERGFREHKDDKGLAHVLFARGDLARRRGDTEQALRAYADARDLYKTSDALTA